MALEDGRHKIFFFLLAGINKLVEKFHQMHFNDVDCGLCHKYLPTSQAVGS
jgi:hypothetical protein